MSQNTCTADEQPELGVSVNTEVVPINSPWTINRPLIGMACKRFRRGTQKVNGGQPAHQESVAIRKGHGNGFPVGEGYF